MEASEDHNRLPPVFSSPLETYTTADDITHRFKLHRNNELGHKDIQTLCFANGIEGREAHPI